VKRGRGEEGKRRSKRSEDPESLKNEGESGWEKY